MTNEIEIWKDVVGYEGFYEISEYGTLRNSQTKKVKKPFLASNGYLVNGVTVDYKQFRTGVHRFVAIAFVDGYKPELQVNHKDGDKLNNHYSNLEWTTPRANVGHSIDIGLRKQRGEDGCQSKLTNEIVIEARYLMADGFTLSKIKSTLSLDCSLVAIRLSCLGKTYFDVKPSLNDILLSKGLPIHSSSLLGENNKLSKLTESMVLQIRNLSASRKISSSKVKKELNLSISISTINKVVRREIWNHVK